MTYIQQVRLNFHFISLKFEFVNVRLNNMTNVIRVIPECCVSASSVAYSQDRMLPKSNGSRVDTVWPVNV